MPYAIPERIYRAYQNVIDFYKAIKERISNPEELLIFGGWGYADGDVVYIRRPGVGVDWFVNNFERLRQRAVRITPANFHKLFPQPVPVQLTLDLESRLGERGKESSPNPPK